MPLQNRVTPEGAIIACAARGTMMGNRGGCFHRADRTLSSRHWATRQWISCRLAFKGRRRTVMAPGLYTELFFLDEATALAAGHRPCFECRRDDAQRFQRLFAATSSLARLPTALEMDDVLHAERLSVEGAKQVVQVDRPALPDGAIYRATAGGNSAVCLLRWCGRDLTWTPLGYAPAPAGAAITARVACLTPPSIVRILQGGYRPHVHPSADGPPRIKSVGTSA